MNNNYSKFTLTYLEAIKIVGIFLIGIVISGILFYIKESFIWQKSPLLNTIILIINAVPLLLVWIYGCYIAKKKQQNFAWKYLPKWQLIPLLIWISLAMMYLISFSTQFIPNDSGLLKEFYDNYEKTIKSLMNPRWAFVLATCVLAPILEEIFLRGILLNGLLSNTKTKKEAWLAILFTALLFGIIHANPWQFMAATIAGIILGYIFYCTNSLGNTIFIHFINNAVSAFLLFKYGESEPAVLQNFPWYAILIVLISLLIGLFLINTNVLKK